MSSDLSRTAALTNSGTFRDLVRAAVIEHAVNVIGISTSPSTKEQALAARAFYDADSVLRSFVWACADDAAISQSTGVDVDAADVRRVVADVWAIASAAVPNLGV